MSSIFEVIRNRPIPYRAGGGRAESEEVPKCIGIPLVKHDKGMHALKVCTMPVIYMLCTMHSVLPKNLGNGWSKSIVLENKVVVNFDFRHGAKKSGHLDHPLQSYGQIYVNIFRYILQKAR